jgi:hypothetical protein
MIWVLATGKVPANLSGLGEQRLAKDRATPLSPVLGNLSSEPRQVLSASLLGLN